MTVRWRPLEGIDVVDAASWVAGPWCSQVLSWLGARVTKVDPPGGDPLRQLDDGQASMARCLDDDANRGKVRRSTADDAAYAALVRNLVAGAQVLICDWTPRRQRELAMSPRALRAQHPGLVVTSVTAYGLSGPDADRAGCELTAYHGGGEAATLPNETIARHFPDRPPVRAGCWLADHDTGLTAALATVGALVGRERSGRGELVEISAQEVEIGLNRTTVSRALWEDVDFDRTYRGYDYAGALLCTDGWVAVRPVEESQWRGLCRVMGRPGLADDPRFATRGLRYDNADELTGELECWTRVRSRAETRAALLLAGCPGGPFLAPGELLDDPPVASRGLFGPVPSGGFAPSRAFIATGTGSAGSAGRAGFPPWPALPAGQLPLAGLRVVDLTWVAAGPYATELLGFLGAEVIRVESGDRPDIFRRSQNGTDDLDGSVRWMDLNQAKRSVEADLKTEQGTAAVLGLVEHAHVLADNFRPGVRERLGLGDDVLRAVNPALVVLALSGFGTEALDADRPGYASVFNAEGGLGWMTGYPDAPPSDVRDTNDLRGGTLGALAVAAGLFAAARGGGAVSLDVATRDALVVLQGHLVLRASRGASPTRSGNALDSCVPYGCWRAADGRWVAIGVRTDDEWAALAGVTGVAGAADRRSRLGQRAAIDAALASWVARLPAYDVIQMLGEVAVPVALSAMASDIARDPHLRERDALREVSHPRLGALRLVQAPFVLDSVGRPAYARPPLLGEHSAELLSAPTLAGGMT